LTPGEPAGIGPDLAVSLSKREFDFPIVIVADPQLLLQRARELSIQFQLLEYSPGCTTGSQVKGQLSVLPVSLQKSVIPGRPDSGNTPYLINTLNRAIDGCLAGEFSAMVTGPVNKAVINGGGIRFSGHTEYIAERCNNAFPVMMLMNDSLRVALATTHLPLADVPRAITEELLEKVILTTHKDLSDRFQIVRPRILVCGLNPHAGEQGYLGSEEIEIHQPVIKKLVAQGLDITGPVPADTAFTPAALKDKDAVICMYHDQGLPVLKSLGFGEIVNITLGLPIIRTSVDHGTAFDLAATGKAQNGSLLAAINCAAELAARSE
jgi:4-hydroxythreonine-4-phosphate dehydrogenase